MSLKCLQGAALLIWILFSAVQVSAMGTPEDQSEDIFSLGEVVVSGRTEGIEAAETVHTISAEEIKRSSARTLDEALVLLSDVNVQVGNDAVPRIEIRGFKARDVLFLLNGIPMNAAFDQQFDPTMIPVENIAAIKVTAGASSVLYGQGGLGGVVNIITKKGGKGLGGLLGFESGDGEPYSTKASVSGSKGKFDFFASGSVFRRDYFPMAKPFTANIYEAQGYRKNSDYTRDNAFINVGFTPNEDLNIALTGNWVQGGYGKPASAITSTVNGNTFDPYAPPPKFGRVDWYGGYTLQLAADYAPSRALDVRSALYYNRMDQDNNQYDDENYGPIAAVGPDGNYIYNKDGSILANNVTVPNSYMFRNRGIVRGYSLQPKYDLGRMGIVSVGTSGEWDTWADTGLEKNGGSGGSGGGAAGGHGIGGGSPPYEIFSVKDHYNYSIYFIGIEYQVALPKNVGFAVGYGHHWQLRSDKNLEDYSVSASLYYDLFRNTRLKAAFERNIHFPTMSQLYLRDTANPNLVQERVYHYQLGLEQRLPWRSVFRIDGFRSDLYNFIALNQNVVPAVNVNFPLYRFHGFETSLETNFLPNINLKADYTMNISQDLSSVGRDEVQYTPRDKFTFTGRYDFDFGLSPFVSVIYVANSYVYSKQQIATVLKHQMSNYTVVNVKLNQRLYKDKVNLYIGADNLLNKDYEQSYGIPRPGRFIFGGVEYRFSI